MQEKTPTLIRTENELDRLCAVYSKKIGCKLKNSGSAALFYRVAAKEKLLRMNGNLANIPSVDWAEAERYTATN